MEHASATPEPSRPKNRTPWNTLSARVISLVSRKGGVGKTTSAVNLGAAFALSGHTVLIVGVDPQCGVARTLGCGPEDLDGGLLDLWDHDVSLTHLAQTSPLKNLFFASSRVRGLEEEERYLALMASRTDLFIQQVDRARDLYDTILIDCPPHLGAPTRAALQASDGVLVPVQAEELCRDSLGTLLGALDTFNEARGGEVVVGPELEGIFLTMLNERTKMGRHVAAKVAEEFGPILLDTTVPRTTRLSEMALRGKPSVIYDRRSSGSRAYFNLADEIMSRYCEREGLAAAGSAGGAPRAWRDVPAALGALAWDEPGRAAPSESGADSGGFGLASGLETLLGALRAGGGLDLPPRPSPAEPASPELVSLEDLIAEEELDGGETWDEPWLRDDGSRDRFH